MKPHRTPTQGSLATAGKEIEVKLSVVDRLELHRLLFRLRAKQEGVRVHEMNILYDTAENVLRRSGQMLRIRVVRPARVTGSAGKAPKGKKTVPAVATLTYKGPEQPNASKGTRRSPAYKVRQECEGRVGDAGAVAAVLEGSGLRPSFRYEKYRSTFRLPGLPGLKVELDETPIGDFLELEGGRAEIDRAAKLLGFGPTDYITRSYGALYVEHSLNRPVGARQKRSSMVRAKGDMLFSAEK